MECVKIYFWKLYFENEYFPVCRKIKVYRKRRQFSIWEYIKYEKYEVLSVINKFNKKIIYIYIDIWGGRIQG